MDCKTSCQWKALFDKLHFRDNDKKVDWLGVGKWDALVMILIQKRMSSMMILTYSVRSSELWHSSKSGRAHFVIHSQVKRFTAVDLFSGMKANMARNMLSRASFS